MKLEANTILMLGLILGFFIVFLILMCVLCPYGICPPYECPCCPSGGGGDGGDDDDGQTTCSDPGLRVTMREDENELGVTPYTIAEIMDGAEDVADDLNITHTIWVESPTKVGFDEINPEIPLLCRGLEEEVNDRTLVGRLWLDFADSCYRADGRPICNPGFLGCVCYTTPYPDCAWTMGPSDPENAVCGGECPSGEKCVSIEDVLCECVPDEEQPEEYTCYDWEDEQTCSQGTCPPEMECVVAMLAGGCACTGPL